MNHDKVIERTVDSLQRIYSFLLALSLGQAVTIVLLDSSTRQFQPLTLEWFTSHGGVKFFSSVFPIVLAFFVTLIPFHQGMNRHLDAHYLSKDVRGQKKGLLLDFVFFMFEGGIFFAIASSVRMPNQAIFFFGLLLVVDIIWAVVSRLVHGADKDRALAKWPGINFVTLIIGFLILALNFITDETKFWVLFLIALTRTICDYRSSWGFYFPFESETNTCDESSETELRA